MQQVAMLQHISAMFGVQFTRASFAVLIMRSIYTLIGSHAPLHVTVTSHESALLGEQHTGEYLEK